MYGYFTVYATRPGKRYDAVCVLFCTPLSPLASGHVSRQVRSGRPAVTDAITAESCIHGLASLPHCA